MNTVGLFAGIGGLELGLARSGHQARLLVEIDPAADRVLQARFDVERAPDVRRLRSLPASTELVAAGFPCQDLSQAGRTSGIHGRQSSLVAEVFRLVDRCRVPCILLENVPFMLQLGRGEAIRHIVDRLEELGYAWAYRTLDTRAFGLPQRRERVFLLASRVFHPAGRLFAHQVEPLVPRSHDGCACGFYWTEGNTGLGWAVDAVPTLKGGSALGIPSPPAIWAPDGRISTPDIRDAERLQGFEPDWTAPAEQVAPPGYRWKLVGNAVSPPVAAWLGDLLHSPGGSLPEHAAPLCTCGSWPPAAYGSAGQRWVVPCSTWPLRTPAPGLLDYLRFPPKSLSRRATVGFVSRLERSSLRYPPEFLAALRAHAASD